MRSKHLNQMRILECLISNREMSFEQLEVVMGVDIDAIHSRTLSRYINELLMEEYIVCNQGRYRLNTERFLANNNGINDGWRKLLNYALESGEIECYRKIRAFIKPTLQGDLFNDEALSHYKNTIIENIRILDSAEGEIQLLRTAIQDENELQIEYKGKLRQIVPLCVVTSRDGYRNYLFGLRRKKLEAMALADVRIIKFLGKTPVLNREEYIDKIQQSWDIDTSDPTHVKVLLRKKYDNNRTLEKRLQKYFGKPIECKEENCIFEGDLAGIPDFVAWVREHIEAVCILEPENKREELIEALKVKIERYRENG